ncbi:PREDICTED: DPH4 homolog [Vollenhovia emeryi]|uniref:DPH4 homolog n=1 Tax=Vollenhovia emeryi TaxID=411798 RepID=UPI0005F539BF|nr:PREDICTED: DPH4 homolog [Vollenhovia emeryi]
MPLNYYKVLRRSQDSTQEELRRAYRQRLLLLHPDKSGNGEFREFEDVREAWRVLGDPTLRRKYDAACRQKCLEEESSPVYARLSPSDLEESGREDTLLYRCRCGGNYLVGREDLWQKNATLEVTCDGCSLVILVET